MRRVLLSFTCAAALGLGACGDDSTPGPADSTQPDTTQPDSTQPDSTQPDTTQPDSTQPDTTQPDSTQPDTTQPDTTEPTPTRKCTDAELDGFNACAEACGDLDQNCINGCFNQLSNECYNAFALFQQCMSSEGCFNDDGSADVECAYEFCEDEVNAVFGVAEPVECNPVSHVGCETGEICTVGDQFGNLYCIPAGDIPAFGDCSANPAGCSTGVCLTGDDGSICMPFCNTNSDCPDGRLCNVGVQGLDYTFCGDIPVACDLVQQNCPANQGCYLASQDGDTTCFSHGGKATGASCQFLNECAPGNLCLGQGNTGTCTKVCDSAAENTGCAAGQTCQALGLEGSTAGGCFSE